MIAENDFDCTRCGACCIADTTGAREGYVDLTARDLRRVPEPYRSAALRMTWPQMPVRKLSGAMACAALEGTLGAHATCAIYDARPRACRAFRPGSRACKMVRELVLDVIDD